MATKSSDPARQLMASIQALRDAIGAYSFLTEPQAREAGYVHLNEIKGNLSKQSAKPRLNKLVKEGKVLAVRVRVGKTVALWYKINGKT